MVQIAKRTGTSGDNLVVWGNRTASATQFEEACVLRSPYYYTQWTRVTAKYFAGNKAVYVAASDIYGDVYSYVVPLDSSNGDQMKCTSTDIKRRIITTSAFFPVVDAVPELAIAGGAGGHVVLIAAAKGALGGPKCDGTGDPGIYCRQLVLYFWNTAADTVTAWNVTNPFPYKPSIATDVSAMDGYSHGMVLQKDTNHCMLVWNEYDAKLGAQYVTGAWSAVGLGWTHFDIGCDGTARTEVTIGQGMPIDHNNSTPKTSLEGLRTGCPAYDQFMPQLSSFDGIFTEPDGSNPGALVAATWFQVEEITGGKGIGLWGRVSREAGIPGSFLSPQKIQKSAHLVSAVDYKFNSIVPVLDSGNPFPFLAYWTWQDSDASRTKKIKVQDFSY